MDRSTKQPQSSGAKNIIDDAGKQTRSKELAKRIITEIQKMEDAEFERDIKPISREDSFSRITSCAPIPDDDFLLSTHLYGLGLIEPSELGWLHYDELLAIARAITNRIVN